MRILALEPFFAGSHQAFLESWQQHSRHDWTVLGLPGRHWKWRMRHAALELAHQVRQLWQSSTRWDVAFCSDMLDLAQFRGLTVPQVAALPTIAYFHENQLTYPVRNANERDLHFAYTNFVTAVAADRVWFNSAFHQQEFLGALEAWLPTMPDFVPRQPLRQLRVKSSVQPPGIMQIRQRSGRLPGPLRIAWAARWEHDKNPADFFSAIHQLKASEVDFRLFVLGQSFHEIPPEFESALAVFSDHIDHWGYVASREQYLQILSQADVLVSTARHEFFGIAVMEGIALGLFPLLPRRLSYPELLGLQNNRTAEMYFYDGSPEHLAARLIELASDPGQVVASTTVEYLHDIAAKHAWSHRAAEMDDAMEVGAS
jgi:glycosyltransferase involved in cell wall biosynthesis